MYKLIRYSGIAVALFAILLTNGFAEAHTLRNNNGYSAVMHIDPDDDPLANQPAIINYLIDKESGGFNQNYYNINVVISVGGKQLKHAVVEPQVFGSAGDGVVKYTFPSIKDYTLDLSGVSKTDKNDQFHMTFDVNVTGSLGGGSTASSNKSHLVVLVSVGSLVILAVIATIFIRRGRRYAAPMQSKNVSTKRSEK
jgi:hypothetical protein